MPPSLDIIIVNWNSGSQLKACLESICGHQFQYALTRVVVVDNGSVDGSLGRLESLDIPLTVVQNETNRGFAAASNQGAAGSAADYLLFLNPDTVLNRESLSRPISFMEDDANEQIGIVGIKLLDDNGLPGRKCCRFPSARMFFNEMTGLAHINPQRYPGHVMVEWGHDDNRAVDHVLGAFYMIRRGVFENVGGFDERYFVYKEDLDLSLQVRNAGWTSYYLADVSAFHRGGGTSEQIRSRRLFYSLRSRIQYGYKHFGWFAATKLVSATFLLEPIARVGWALKRGALREVWETVSGMSRLAFWVITCSFRSRVG